MPRYKVEVAQTQTYILLMDANSPGEAIEKVESDFYIYFPVDEFGNKYDMIINKQEDFHIVKAALAE
jgi:hypothetical protein